MLIGAIADDLTGATDLALMLAREGMRTIQVVGVPPAGFDVDNAEAVVVALKSRTIAADDARRLSLEALAWLRERAVQQVIFKYCSTFDSTPRGNIGPVTEALMAALGADLTIVCPAFPANGRTIYKGNLYVGDQPLAESPMRNHPLTPMTDSSLVRLMQGQSSLRVGLIPYDVVARGETAVSEALAVARAAGQQALVVDAITDADLRTIGSACATLPLITGGSGIALGLPENFRRTGRLGETASQSFSAPAGRAAILAGSCSVATREQIATAVTSGLPALKVDPVEIANGRVVPSDAITWATAQADKVPLIYSSADPDEVKAAQEALGRDRAGTLVENFLAAIAVGLRDRGFRRMIVAGGETSGAVMTAIGAPALFIGREIDPGVPWTLTLGAEPAMALALKSGNFGTPDFFTKAWDLLS